MLKPAAFAAWTQCFNLSDDRTVSIVTGRPAAISASRRASQFLRSLKALFGRWRTIAGQFARHIVRID
jgi:hypothetical protein